MAGETPSEAYIQGLWSRFKERAGGIGETVGAGYNTKRLTEDEEDLIWSNRALTVEQEWDLWRKGMTPEEIGLKVFPEREEFIKSGGRIEPKAWYAKVKTMADRAERKKMQQQSDPMQMSLAKPEIAGEIVSETSAYAPEGGDPNASMV